MNLVTPVTNHIETKGFFQFEGIVDVFPFICYWSTAIIYIVTLTVRGSTWTSESDVNKRQILTSKVDPRAVRFEHHFASDVKIRPFFFREMF